MPLAPLTFVDEPTVMIVPWHDPIVEVVGFEVRSQYVELFWLNVLGRRVCNSVVDRWSRDFRRWQGRIVVSGSELRSI